MPSISREDSLAELEISFNRQVRSGELTADVIEEAGEEEEETQVPSMGLVREDSLAQLKSSYRKQVFYYVCVLCRCWRWQRRVCCSSGRDALGTSVHVYDRVVADVSGVTCFLLLSFWLSRARSISFHTQHAVRATMRSCYICIDAFV